MRSEWRWSGVSIFGRTFLLMFAALLVTAAIELTLLNNQPPRSNGSVTLFEVAAFLRTPGEWPAQPPPMSGNESHPPFGPQDAPPPDRLFEAGPPRGYPGPPLWPNLIVRNVDSRPTAPAKGALRTSDALRTELAGLLRVEPNSVVFFTSTESNATAAAIDAPLRQSFIAGRQLPDGHWRTAERMVDTFPTAFQKQAALLLVLGLALLLPLAWLFASTLSGPIRRFSQAARRMGNDPNAAMLPREGPAEMLLAVDSFNAMQGRINRLIQERTQMIGAMAHDLRTPLTRLAFRLDELPQPLKSKVDADIQEMKSMISAALDFIRDRFLTGQHERLDFRLLVERVVDEHSDLGHDVTLQPGAPMTVEGGPLALRRMVVNLVDNALKYGQRARLRLHAQAQHCLLEIDDDGPGIPEQLQQQVFEPFFRLEASRNRDTGGIGLGLAAARAIVIDHAGEITLGNRKGGGLHVTVRLQLTPA